jgi:hypothetical protein
MITPSKSDRLKAYKTLCDLIGCKEKKEICETEPWMCEIVKKKMIQEK